jgi:hypothetical protein
MKVQKEGVKCKAALSALFRASSISALSDRYLREPSAMRRSPTNAVVIPIDVRASVESPEQWPGRMRAMATPENATIVPAIQNSFFREVI